MKNVPEEIVSKRAEEIAIPFVVFAVTAIVCVSIAVGMIFGAPYGLLTAGGVAAAYAVSLILSARKRAKRDAEELLSMK